MGLGLTTYDCTETQFVENLRKLLEVRPHIIANRLLVNHDDGRYGLAYLPDPIFEKYGRLAKRDGSRSPVRAAIPFIEDRTGRLYESGATVCIGRGGRPGGVSAPYTRVEYSFTIWGDTYRYVFDALFEPEIRLEKRVPRFHAPKYRAKEVPLVHVLRFRPPDEESMKLDLPSAVLTFDVRRRLSPLP